MVSGDEASPVGSPPRPAHAGDDVGESGRVNRLERAGERRQGGNERREEAGEKTREERPGGVGGVVATVGSRMIRIEAGSNEARVAPRERLDPFQTRGNECRN